MHDRRKWKRLMIIAPLAILGLLAFLAVGGEVVKLLWNWLFPSLFGVRMITFWEALGFLALCRILVGGFGLHGSRRHGSGHRIAWEWSQLTPEEKERFRQRMRERWGRDPEAAAPPSE